MRLILMKKRQQGNPLLAMGRTAHAASSIGLLLLFGLIMLRDNAAGGENFAGKIIRIRMLIHNPYNACVHNHLGTDDTGLVRTIQGSALNGNAHFSSLNDSVLLCVYGITQLVARARGNI